MYADHQYRQVEHVLGGQIEWDPPWQRKWESRLESKSNGFPFPNADNTLTVRSSIMVCFQIIGDTIETNLDTFSILRLETFPTATTE